MWLSSSGIIESNYWFKRFVRTMFVNILKILHFYIRGSLGQWTEDAVLSTLFLIQQWISSNWFLGKLTIFWRIEIDICSLWHLLALSESTWDNAWALSARKIAISNLSFCEICRASRFPSKLIPLLPTRRLYSSSSPSASHCQCSD